MVFEARITSPVNGTQWRSSGTWCRRSIRATGPWGDAELGADLVLPAAVLDPVGQDLPRGALPGDPELFRDVGARPLIIDDSTHQETSAVEVQSGVYVWHEGVR